LKPAAAIPASVPEPGSKTGTSIVKSAPPKETARITVKPNLPQAAVRAGGNFPSAAKPVPAAPGAVPVAAAAAVGAAAGAAVAAKAVAAKPVPSGKPATTIVKTAAAPKVASASVKAAPVAATATATSTAPAVATSTQFRDEESTTLTTALAAGLAVLTWGTAGVLIASYLALI
jgi:hypothetical protein